MNIAIFPIILLGVFLNAGAQFLLKTGMNRIGYFDFSWANLLPIGFQVAINPYIIMGLACYLISVVVWLIALSRVDVSIAYPMISIGYVVNALAAYYFLGEHVSFMRMSGILVILIGVYLVAKS